MKPRRWLVYSIKFREGRKPELLLMELMECPQILTAPSVESQ